MTYPNTPQYPNPPQYPPQQPMQYPAAQTSSVSPVLIGIVAGLGIIVIGVMVFLIVMFTGNSEEKTATVTPSATTPNPTVTVHESIRTQTAPPPAENIPWPPSGATATCGSTVAVNNATSCEFAQNVAEAYFSSGTGTVYAYSPVTNTRYKMNCQLSQASVVVCAGGNNAVVYIQQ